MPSLAPQPGGRRRGRPSLWTAGELRAWRDRRGLTVEELATLLGWPVSTLQKKLGGHTKLTLDLDRAIANIEMVIARGGVPDGAPIWLQARLIQGLGWDPNRAARRRRVLLIRYQPKNSSLLPARKP
jgi:transcriptional regulator with XRE-family HTH domain